MNDYSDKTNNQECYTDTQKIEFLNKILKEEISAQQLSIQESLPVRTIKSWMNTFLPGLEDCIDELRNTFHLRKSNPEIELKLELLQQENTHLKNKCLGLIMDKTLMQIGSKKVL